jgi:hypothetical protein
VTQCVDDGTTVLKDFETAFDEIAKGIDHLDRSEIEQGLKSFAVGIIGLAELAHECGLEEIAADLERIAQELQEGPAGWLKLIIDSILDIFSHKAVS